MAELQSEIMSENEELKSTVSRYQEQEKKHKNRILQLERETAIITSQVADYEAKVRRPMFHCYQGSRGWEGGVCVLSLIHI